MRKPLRNCQLDFALLDIFFCYIISAKVTVIVCIGKALDGSICNLGNLADDCLNFPGLHALTVDFHHPVLAVDVDDISVFVPPPQVAGPDHGFMSVRRKMGILYLDLCGFFRHSDVSGHKVPCHTDFTLVSLLTVFIQQIDGAPFHRPPDGRIMIGFIDWKSRNSRTGFGHSVEIVNRIIPGSYIGYPFRTCRYQAQGIASRFEQLQNAGRHKQLGDVHPVDERRQGQGISNHFPGNDRHAGTCAQGV